MIYPSGRASWHNMMQPKPYFYLSFLTYFTNSGIIAKQTVFEQVFLKFCIIAH